MAATPYIFIQARMGSTRLPGKVLTDVLGTPLLGHAVARLRRVRGCKVAILTSDTPENDPIAAYANSIGVAVFRGDEDDVLDRFAKAAEHFDADPVLRATGDNPLPSIEAFQHVLDTLQAGDTDFIITTGWPHGANAEGFTRAALMRSAEEGHAPHHREHVDEYILDFPERFRFVEYPRPGPEDWTAVNVTVDTPEQLGILVDAMRKSGKEQLDVSCDDIATIEAKPRTAILRCDGNHVRGMGHVSRMLTLAGALAEQGITAPLVLREEASARAMVEAAGAKAHFFDPTLDEASIARRVLADTKPGAWMFDVLDTEADWYPPLHEQSIWTATLDDRGSGNRVADAVINSNTETAQALTGAKRAGLYLGLDYMIVGQGALARRRARPLAGSPQTIAIALGGADTYGATPMVLDALERSGFTGTAIACLGPAYAHWDELDAAQGAVSFSVERQISAPDLHAVLDTCEVVIAAGGMTGIECLAMGLPLIGVANEPHEAVLLEALAGDGACVYLGPWQGLGSDDVTRVLNAALTHPSQLSTLSERGLAVVDGKGLDRITTLIGENL